MGSSTMPLATGGSLPVGQRRGMFLHGFGQTGRCVGKWPMLTAALSHVDCPDLPGHGGAESAVGMWDAARTIAGTIDPHCVLIGYSMGGRLALHVALEMKLASARPLDALVLISASPGLQHAGDRAARISGDSALARRIEQIGVMSFTEEWLHGPLFVGLDASTRFEDERNSNNASGLADSLRLAGTGSQDNLWPRLGSIAVPTLIVTGSLDDKFTSIGAEMAQAIGRSAPIASHVTINGAYHSPHLERPDEFAKCLSDFVAAL